MSDMKSSSGIESQKDSLGISTYRSFYLIRDEIRQVVECAVARGKVTMRDLRELTSIGTVHCESAPRFAKAAGLIDSGASLTTFGRIVSKCDPTLSHLSTQWVMHYKMACSHTSGAEFWPKVYQRLFDVGNIEFDKFPALVADVAGIETETTSRAVKYAVVAFLNTYKNNDGLGQLKILDPESEAVQMGEPALPPLWSVAYIVADYWHNVWENRKTVNLSSMMEPGGPASLMLMSSGDINSCLSEMASLGLVEVQRRIPPYSIVRLWESPDSILEHLYDD